MRFKEIKLLYDSCDKISIVTIITYNKNHDELSREHKFNHLAKNGWTLHEEISEYMYNQCWNKLKMKYTFEKDLLNDNGDYIVWHTLTKESY